MEYTIKSLKETEELAKIIAEQLKGNEIIFLNGDLGAGKTTFTKFLASSIGITDIVTSPTFAFMKEYFGKFKLSHFDMYRAETEDDLWELGISDNLYEDGICVVEWNKFKDLPNCKQIINIDISVKDNFRIFNVTFK